MWKERLAINLKILLLSRICIIQSLKGGDDIEWLVEEEMEEQEPKTGKIPARSSSENIIENIETRIRGSWSSNEKSDRRII